MTTDLTEWLAQRAKDKQRLYQQYAKALEKDHTGEYAAIGLDGRTILGKRAGEVLQKAVNTFGERNFGLFRVGYRAFARWAKIKDPRSGKVKTYVFKIEVEQDEDGRWGAEIPTLPGCAAWGYTREEAVEALQDGAQAYLEVMMENNDPLPEQAEAEAVIIPNSEVVAITL